MESGNQFQARFSLVAVVYEFTRWGTGEYSLCREVPEPCLVLFFFAAGSSGALPTVSTRVVLFFCACRRVYSALITSTFRVIWA